MLLTMLIHRSFGVANFLDNTSHLDRNPVVGYWISYSVDSFDDNLSDDGDEDDDGMDNEDEMMMMMKRMMVMMRLCLDFDRSDADIVVDDTLMKAVLDFVDDDG
ncbi:hypothetical protein QR98_0042050 [Sarcoptes scabiei]|uniref:Uncharacterized protein n=1 Tax=Sarcoptes scabiei TaxID=52283 RepID=A0A132A426_SARSC|nr:hypothetical protein QR98_0042050 [Sarcoptes scabiei]